mgnify:CR=1 FL=1
MIKQYKIHNFKNHADTSLELRGLTILTGVNGMGKSSVFQSMLILRESYLRRPSMKMLSLDGDSFSVGSSAGLVNRNVTVGEDLLQLGIATDERDYVFSYRYPVGDKNEMETTVDVSNDVAEHLQRVSLFNDNFQYLSAFRMGPQAVYQSHTGVVDKHRQISDRMGMGEYVAYYLSLFGGDKIPVEALAYPGSDAVSLGRQTELWMGEISKGIKMQIHQHGGQYDLKYGYEVPGKTTIYHSALNTGFGISYVLSVIVAILSARPGALLLIENPEAHIHPSGQAALMKLISKAAMQGIQIILETHSDHIVNGALVNWKELHADKSLLAVYYFERDESLNSKPVRLEIGDNGRIKNAPLGFFDQMKADLEVLFDF